MLKKPQEKPKVQKVELLTTWSSPSGNLDSVKKQMTKNISSAVDKQIENIMADLINEFNTMGERQYEDINQINADLEAKNGVLSDDEMPFSKPVMKEKSRPIMDDLDELEDWLN